MNRKKLLIYFLLLTTVLFLLLPSAYTRPTRGCSTYDRDSSSCASATHTDWQWATGYNLTIGQFVALNDVEMDRRKSSYGDIMSDTDTLSRVAGQLAISAAISAVVCVAVSFARRQSPAASPEQTKSHDKTSANTSQ